MQHRLPIYDPSRESVQATSLMSACLTEPCVDFVCGSCTYNRPHSCFYFHSTSQRRRHVFGEFNQILYWDAICPQITLRSLCSNGSRCQFSHTKTEMCYHPARFKTKLCNGYECRGAVCCFAHAVAELRTKAPLLYGYSITQDPVDDVNCERILHGGGLSVRQRHTGTPITRFCPVYPNSENCEFGPRCPFAHDGVEIITPLLNPNEVDFYVLSFKTQWCVFGHRHDWNNCIYAHNSQDCRRCPTIGYGQHACPSWETSDPRLGYAERCPAGLRCPWSHGRKEQLYHPAFYRTNACCDWRKPLKGEDERCIRGPLCAFFHSPLECRSPVVSSDVAYDGLLEEELVNKVCGHLKDPPVLVSVLSTGIRNVFASNNQLASPEEDLDMNEFVKFALN
jgi:hypothetical protein